MTSMAVAYQKTPFLGCFWCCMVEKVIFEPFQAYVVGCPPILASSEFLIGHIAGQLQDIVWEPGRLHILRLSFENDGRGDMAASCRNGFNYGHPLAILSDFDMRLALHK